MSARCRPTRSTSCADDEHEPEHPDDVEADDGEDVGLLVVVADDDVAGQVHHAGHHREARERGDARPTVRRAAAGSAPSGAAGVRRRRAPGASPARSSSSAIVRGSGRIARARMSPTTHIAAAANHGMTSVSSSRSLPGEQRTEDERARARRRRAHRRGRTRSRAPSRSGGYMSAAAVRASSTAPFIAPTPRKPRITSGALSSDAAERRQHAADRADDEAARDHGNAPEPVHQPSGRQRRERPGGEEDRRAEAEDRLDPGDEDERDRRHGDRELEHAGEQSRGRARAGPCYAGSGASSSRDRAIQPARPGTPAPRRGRDGEP